MSAATDPEITKDFLAAQLAQLELRLAERVMASERYCGPRLTQKSTRSATWCSALMP